ncbi:hypothetical protein CHH92_09465 [Bacillus sonorensis]|nr:hypothetical protein [Bacillus sonorensis]PAD60423.1 hypothetical protein CHH92_09465 [Bacillus sonorensis]TWK83683.1 hypothetical protein CHCC20335_4754 [Bacillus paralicheniformis]GIN65611.1 hypothetical protein J41TS2_10320 [Bacillus sonorensis]
MAVYVLKQDGIFTQKVSLKKYIDIWKTNDNLIYLSIYCFIKLPILDKNKKEQEPLRSLFFLHLGLLAGYVWK